MATVFLAGYLFSEDYFELQETLYASSLVYQLSLIPNLSSTWTSVLYSVDKRELRWRGLDWLGLRMLSWEQAKKEDLSQMATYWFVIGWFDNQSVQKSKVRQAAEDVVKSEVYPQTYSS